MTATAGPQTQKASFALPGLNGSIGQGVMASSRLPSSLRTANQPLQISTSTFSARDVERTRRTSSRSTPRAILSAGRVGWCLVIGLLTPDQSVCGEHTPLCECLSLTCRACMSTAMLDGIPTDAVDVCRRREWRRPVPCR